MKRIKIIRSFVKLICIVIVLGIISVLVYCAICFINYIDIIGIQWKVFFQYSVIAIGALGYGWIIVALLNHIFGRKIMIGIVLSFVILYVGGIFAYSELNNNSPDILTEKTVTNIIPAINSSLSIFFPSRGDYDPQLGGNIQYHLVQLAGYLFFALLAFSILGRRAIHFTLYCISIPRETYVFWNYSISGILLAEDIIKNNAWSNIVFVLPHTSKDDEVNYKSIFDKIDCLGGIVVYRNMESSKESKVKGKHHFFITEDQDFNIRKALDVSHRKDSNARRWYSRKIHLHIRSEMEYVGHLFPSCEKTDIDIFSQSDITARQFIQEHPMLDVVPREKKEGLRVNYDFHVLILGFGWSGRELLNKTICDTQFVGSTFSASIVDNTIKNKHGDYFSLYKDCIKEYNLKFEEDTLICEVGSHSFYRWFEENFNKFDRIIVSLGDDSRNIETGLSLSRIMMKCQPYRNKQVEYKNDINDTEIIIPVDSNVIQKKLFVQTKDSSKYVYANYPMTLFGNLKDVYTEKIIIKEEMDLIAKAVNYIYNKPNMGCYLYFDKDDVKEMNLMWDRDLAVFNKNSSRAVAMNIDNILNVVGVTQFYPTIANEENISLLADWEHRRWSAFILTKGVSKWDYSVIPQGHTTKAKLFLNHSKQNILLRHACLVPTNKLHVISERVGENFIETDKRIVTHFLLFKTAKLK